MKFNTDSILNKKSITPWLILRSSFLVLVISYILLKLPLSFIRLLSFSLRVDLWPIIPIAGLLIYFIFRIPGRTGAILSVSAVLILFILPLIGMWAYGHSQTSVLSGLIQTNDASAYYTDALRITAGRDFSFFATRRPLFPGFLSVLLITTNYNLMATLVILCAITAISCYLMAREIQKTNGTETALFLLMMVFLYYRLHSGITMSENFGIAIGTLGFTTLWLGSSNKKLWLIGFGILITTLALNARAGAFFILPLLIIWAGWVFRESKYISWQAIIVASGAVFLGFSCDLLLGHLIGQTGGIPFANFSYTLYSLASGGKSWAYIGVSHPEVFLLSEPEHTKRVFQLAFELMRENPYQTIQGAIFFWKALFTNTLYNVFAFVAKENWGLNPVVKWGLYFLSMVGIFTTLKNRRSPINALIIVCIAGIFLSVPFVPPTDSFRIRPYASSIAMICILPALGFGYLTNRMNLKSFIGSAMKESPSTVTVYFTTLLILLTLIGPVIIRYNSSMPSLSLQACKSGAKSGAFLFAKGTYVNIIKNTDDILDWPPNYHVYLLHKNAHSMEDVNLINWLGSIKPSNSMLIALDIINNRGVWLILPTKILPERTGYIQFCGDFEEDLSLKPYSIFNVSETIYLAPK